MFKNAIQDSALRITPNKQSLEFELGAVEKELNEILAPVRLLEAEIGRIRSAIGRGKALSISDPAQFEVQGGENLLNQLESALSAKLSYQERLNAETQNLQQPLQITKSDLLALLAKKQEKSQERKEREELLREEKKSPINLRRWVNRAKNKPTIFRVLAMAEKRENQILQEICGMYHLKLVSKKELSQHYSRKHSQYRLHLYRRGYYLIPDDQPKGRKIKEIQNHDQITTHERKNEATRTT